MKRWAYLALLLVVLPLAGGADPGVVREVAFHQFQDVTFEARDFRSSCNTGGVEVPAAGHMFTFIEGKGPGPGDEQSRGEFWAGCGTMRRPMQVMPTADHLVVRFQADRERSDTSPATQDTPLLQDFVIRDEGIQEIQSRAVFEPTAGDTPATDFAMTFVGDVGGQIYLDWVFADQGVTQQNLSTAGLGGSALSSTVSNVYIEATGDALPSLVSKQTDEVRYGTRLTTETRVSIEVPEFSGGAPAIRVRVAPGLELVRVITANGTMLEGPSTLADGVLGKDHDDVVVQLTPTYTQGVVPRSIVDAGGPGTYTLVFEESRGLAIQTPLVPLSIVLLAAPLPFAVLAWVGARAYRKEAFGAYARSARNLQYGVALVLLYYVAVVASAALGGRLDLMALDPMPMEGVLLYVQLALAGVAFTSLWLVARELYAVLKPRPTSG